MVKIYTAPSSGTVQYRRTNPVEPSSTEGETFNLLEQEVIVERRRSSDRRQQRRDRGRFDMRAGRDRRKNRPGHTSIDLDV